MNQEIFSLYEITTLVREVINYSFNETYWIKAEIAKIKENTSGHCYIELVEKSEQNDGVIAQCQAILWRNIYFIVAARFREITGQPLSTGMKILFRARLEFHQIYGFSLHIIEIDPHFTLGELIARKKQIIEQLKREGIFDINKMVTFPKVPQRIAVVSSKTAAGYYDFIKHLQENPSRYQFHIQLFQAIMQGVKAESSIIKALEKIFERCENFDIVVIIRGGGSQVDLSCFDNYLLASHVAQFPLPILTGIGHEQDESIVDMVAHRAFKTPTAVAVFLIDTMAEFEFNLNHQLDKTIKLSSNIILQHKHFLSNLNRQIPAFIKEILHYQYNRIDNMHLKAKNIALRAIEKNYNRLEFSLANANFSVNKFIQRNENILNSIFPTITTLIHYQIKQQLNHLNMLNTKAALSDPAHILNKGYSITLLDGKVLKKASDIPEGAYIETILYEGKLISKVIKKNN